MARVIVSVWLLLVLFCCVSNAQSWRNWFWGDSGKTTLAPTKAAQAEDQTSQELSTPAATTSPKAPFESTTDPEPLGKGWNVLTPKQPDFTTDSPASPSQEEGREGNIAGVGAEILNVAEGIRNLVQLLDEKTTKGTERTEVPATTEISASPAPVTELGSIQNMTDNLMGDGQTSLQTRKPAVVPSVTTKFALLWNRTRVLLKKPGKPRQGSASFSFSPDDHFSGTMLVFQESPEVGQEGAFIPATRAAWGAFSKNQGILSTAKALKLQEPQTSSSSSSSSSSLHAGMPSKVVGALDNGVLPYVPNSSQPLSKVSRAHLSFKSHPCFKHSGIAVADAQTNHSSGSASNSSATNSMDPPPANHSDSFEFLLTYAVQHSNSSSGLASFFPGLTPTAGRCLPLPTKLSYCNHLGMKHFRVPNYLHHSSEEEVRAALHEWEGLLKSRCHRYLEWFLCLLLVPGCNASLPVTPPPCRGFCEALKDLCWIHWKEGRLPISCDSLPAEDGPYSCVFVNVSAGNKAGLIVSS
ncbi:collagen alpha-1(XVIII) chain-like [Python bivittatus]|uniref:Collagen alpha-1(XVIII) chain-like n=1 Tax=Python bivittatus TaxID=176946 RepID=A0A9F2R5V6_PYTBI|nr:collagen alpha-1(XVIII) chain-like [Python bivittatus]